MIKVFLLTVVLMAVVMFFLAIKILFSKSGRFPNIHIGGNKALAKKGVFCARTQDKLASNEISPYSKLYSQVAQDYSDEFTC